MTIATELHLKDLNDFQAVQKLTGLSKTPKEVALAAVRICLRQNLDLSLWWELKDGILSKQYALQSPIETLSFQPEELEEINLLKRHICSSFKYSLKEEPDLQDVLNAAIFNAGINIPLLQNFVHSFSTNTWERPLISPQTPPPPPAP